MRLRGISVFRGRNRGVFQAAVGRVPSVLRRVGMAVVGSSDGWEDGILLVIGDLASLLCP